MCSDQGKYGLFWIFSLIILTYYYTPPSQIAEYLGDVESQQVAAVILQISISFFNLYLVVAVRGPVLQHASKTWIIVCR